MLIHVATSLNLNDNCMAPKIGSCEPAFTRIFASQSCLDQLFSLSLLMRYGRIDLSRVTLI